MKAKNTPWSVYIRNGLGRRLAVIGERTGQEWLVYNPLVMRQFHDEGMRNAQLVAPVMMAAYPQARTLLDVGCGTGAFVAEFSQRGCKSIGLERSPHGRKLALRQKVDCRDFDLTLGVPANVTGKFDLVYCFEVAEHMPAKLGHKLIEYLCHFRSPIVFSAAQPGQGGTGHINEQPTEYWMENFVAFAFVFDPVKTDTLRNGFAANGAAPWFERNTIALMPGS